MKLNPRIVTSILRHCSESFVSITPLVDTLTSGSNLYRYKDEMLRLGWLEMDGRKKFHTTPQGMLQLRTLLGEAPTGLSDVCPILAQVPPRHRAMIELILSAVEARDLREDRHLAFVMVGPTLTWKTSMARVLCILLGLDPVKNIVDMGVESGLSLWRRKTPTGGVAYRRELLDSRFVTFDEAQRASKECIRQLDKWTSGTKRVAFENSEEVIQSVSLILMNPREGKTLKDRLGMDEPTLRRRIICEVTRAGMPNLATTGEEIVEAAKKHGPIQLPKPRHDSAKYKQSIYELFKKTFNQEGQQLVDVESLALLCWGMTAFKEPVEAIRLVFYDALLLYETLGWTIPGWQQMVSQYPEIPRLDGAEVAPTNEVPHELLVKAFKHLDEGGSPASLVTELEMTPNQAEETAKTYFGLQAIQVKNSPKVEAEEDPKIKGLQRDVLIAKLEREKYEATAPIERSKELATLMANIAIIQDGGREKMKVCVYFDADHCDLYGWRDKPTDGVPPGEVFFKDGWWVIRLDPIACAACSNYIAPTVITEVQLDEKTSEISQTVDSVKNSLAKTPTYRLHDRFTCKWCGAKGFVAVKVMCTRCKTEDEWGWHPS